MRVLVTGGAGFIGSHYVRELVSGSYPAFAGAEVVVLDKLTYAGSETNLAPVAGKFEFVRGDICDPVVVSEQMRGVVGPANMPPEAVTWWQDTLKKVVATDKWQKDYIKRNLLTPTDWTGEQALKYLDSLHSKYEDALKGLKATQK